jgi:hypothetical protein
MNAETPRSARITVTSGLLFTILWWSRDMTGNTDIHAECVDGIAEKQPQIFRPCAPRDDGAGICPFFVLLRVDIPGIPGV